MWIKVDTGSGEPIFEQIVFQVKKAVARGTAAPGDKLPSVRSLARELAINPNTVIRALQELEKEGVIVRRQGSGCFIAPRRPLLSRQERQRQLTELLRRTVTQAYHLGFEPDRIRAALDRELQDFEPDRERGGQ